MRNTLATQTLFELSRPGRRAERYPACDVPERAVKELIPAEMLAAQPPALPELAEPDVIRHFTNLSQLNMSVDTHFYPLGSCTMKYNPKRNERLANLPGIVDVHPLQPDHSVQGLLALLYEMQQILAEIAGLPEVSLQPAAGVGTNTESARSFCAARCTAVRSFSLRGLRSKPTIESSGPSSSMVRVSPSTATSS